MSGSGVSSEVSSDIFTFDGGSSSTNFKSLQSRDMLVTTPTSISKPIHSNNKANTRSVKKKKKQPVVINTFDCKYDIVKHCSIKSKFKIAGTPQEPWQIYWIDTGVSMERVMAMKPFQKINHFPGMSEICRKDHLARNLNKMAKLYPKEYDFSPKTWVLPLEFGDFAQYVKAKKNKPVFIAKPDSGSQGKGIFLFKDPQVIKCGTDMIVQRYVNKPFLIDGFKFDLRVYVLITSSDPLRVFIFREGLGRFATESYKEPTFSNMNNTCMHLTNYAINKHSDKFDKSDSGSKRKLTAVLEWLRDNNYPSEQVWDSIKDVIVKTILTVQPHLSRIHKSCFPNRVNGSSCFEILGFDILLDSKLKPWVLEVNHSPSFSCDSSLDFQIKESLILNTFKLLNIQSSDQRKFDKFEKAQAKKRLLGKLGSGNSDKSVKRTLPNVTKRDVQAAILHNEREDEISNPGCKDILLEETKKTLKSHFLNRDKEEFLSWLEKFEDENCDNFQRIFPSPDKTLQEKYQQMIQECANIFCDTNANKARRAHLQKLRFEENLKKTTILMKRAQTSSGSSRTNSFLRETESFLFRKDTTGGKSHRVSSSTFLSSLKSNSLDSLTEKLPIMMTRSLHNPNYTETMRVIRSCPPEERETSNAIDGVHSILSTQEKITRLLESIRENSRGK